MPVYSEIVGAQSDSLTHEIDARWLMAYAAGLNDCNPRYMDTATGDVIGHPVFPVCLEWAVQLTLGNIPDVRLPSRDESARAVHGTHDLHIYRPVIAGDRLTTGCTYVDLRETSAGAALTMRLDSHDAGGTLVARTYQVGIYRGVSVEGEVNRVDHVPEVPAWHLPTDARATSIEVAEGAAHVYTECARIWNPIHSDRAYALAAGLPDIILHGTAALALAVTRIVNEYADGDPGRVTRLGGRFAAMVLMPTTLTLESFMAGEVVSFQLKNASDDIVIRDGFVCMA